ncbi:glycoside hydrolase family 6 protein [Streptomyces somaliensis DSM 40738]|uniref:Glucanase n=1 Tax=Streptomyces somaliensis (strain ATCC 33201 / DSM 40738 / JCM 12659 / KCTC 9044 / NCTC 11332 / NRRL B-12077 / IP 733) TaxID=1134445 RepID=A0AA44DB01_STRE0|nr:glycoside hydrolase family 6 protein [Streptomyces somaliensis]MCQ0023612.1 glycoside hydrolase family 6 protein [Streptomyces somaliensis DSM 40738]NKY13501.1 glycoside hydrolase family 6 protein [Streptomyces somaliensis DSM 40738]
MSGNRSSFRGPFVPVLTAVLLASGCASGPGRDSGTAGEPPSIASVGRGEAAAPSSGSPFWVDPDSAAARQVKEYEAAGRTEDARLLRRISERPAAVWPSGGDPVPDVARAVRGATREGRTAVLVAYNVPHRDCGRYSAGGAPDAEAYRRWIDAFAGAVGDARAVVVVEPDAVPHLVDGCAPGAQAEERYGLLSYAVERLKRQPNTKVYLDAGNPEWLREPGRLVEPLRRAGVGRADGFALNVANFQTDEAVREFGTELSGLLGGAHFVVDTSRNGAGPLPGGGEESWCNPPGRALGTPPTLRTGDRLVDAYLWVKRPGESDGTCRGGPAAGTWWPEYALGLARRADG